MYAAAKILYDAADLVEAGWTQGVNCLVRSSGQRCYCAGGAINRAASDLSCSDAAWAEARDTLMAELPYSHVIAWNDDPKRTQEDVVKTLRTVAEKIERAEA